MADVDPSAVPGDGITRFQLDLLRATEAQTDPIGSDIQTWLQGHYETAVHHGRIYQNLDILADAGLVTRTAANRRSNIIRLTDAGRSVLATYRAFLRADGGSDG